MQNNHKNTIEVYVELLDEGSETWRPTMAEDIGDGFYKLLPIPNYDPEDEAWAFLPNDIVRIEQVRFANDKIGMAVRHSNPNVITIDVEQIGKNAPWIKRTNALSIGDGLYKVLPTPTYESDKEIWKFPPNSIVRLKKIESADGLFTFLVASEK